MMNHLRKIALWGVWLALPLFFISCGNNTETPQSTSPAVSPNTTQQTAKVQPKSVLPEKLLNLGLTDDQKTKCEAAYQEIFTPDIMAQRKEMYRKLHQMEKDSAEYLEFKKQISETFKPYNVQFNKRLRGILTPEQQSRYFAKKNQG